MTRPPAPRSTRSTARAASRWRAAATSMRSAAGSRATATATSRAPRATGRAITPGRVLKWVALAIAGWLLLSLVLFLISAQTQDGVSPATERALSSKGSLFTGQQHPRARLRRAHRRLDRRVPGRPRPLRHDHARPLRLRKRPQALDPARRRGGGPRPRDQQDQRRLRVRRTRAHDRDRGVVPRERPRGEPRRRGGLQELPGLHRLARRGDGQQQDARLLAPVRQLLEGPPLQEGRDRAERRACAGLRARAEEQLRARPRTTAPGRRASSRC